MNAKRKSEPTEPAATPATRRDAERKLLRQRLVRLIAQREAAKQAATRALREI